MIAELLSSRVEELFSKKGVIIWLSTVFCFNERLGIISKYKYLLGYDISEHARKIKIINIITVTCNVFYDFVL